MAKRYTCDGKLLTELPEVEFNKKIYGVDNRYCTVNAFSELEKHDFTAMLTLALGEDAATEIDPDTLPLPALINLIEVVTAAMTGEKQEDVAARFQEAKSETEQQ